MEDIQLLGIGDLSAASTSRIADVVRKSEPQKVAAVLKRVSVQAVSSGLAKGKRAAMLSQFENLPENIQTALFEKKMRMTDAQVLYWTKLAGGSTSVKVIRTDDNKAAGYTNVAVAKLDKGKPFLVTAIQLLSGVAADGVTVPSEVDFGVAAPAVINGQFTFAVKSIPVAENSPCQVFDTTNMTVAQGYYELDNYIFLPDQEEIKFDLELPVAAAARTWVRVVLHGVAIVAASA